MIKRKNSHNSKIQGSIFGLIVGDALGVPVEFKSRNYLSKHPLKTMIGGGIYKQSPGSWSDDTSMVLATMNSLINGYNSKNIMKNFALWYDQGKFTPKGEVFDIGFTTKDSINWFKSKKSKPWGGTKETENGNGSLMRILPISLYFLNKSNKILIEKSFEGSELTHAHIRSKLACAYFSLILKAIIIFKYDIKNSLIYANKELKNLIPKSEKIHFKRILDLSILNEPKSNIKSSGYVIHCLEASIWCINKTTNYRDAVLTAINLGEDTDTTGAVTGALAGAIYGYDEIPEKWINKLIKINYIKSLSRKFINIVLIRIKNEK